MRSQIGIRALVTLHQLKGKTMRATDTPPGLTSTGLIPYGERRWNGAVWARIQVDTYNAELARIASRHAAGMPVESLVNGLYNLAHGFDVAGKVTR